MTLIKTHPLVYEINTRCWLRELSTPSGQPATLGSVPDAEFERWRDLGFTHIWLMGVWPTGRRGRATALADPNSLRALAQILPDWPGKGHSRFPVPRAGAP